jgi:hypothetical protein
MEQLQVNSPVSAGERAEHLGEHFPEQSASLDRLLTIARRGLASAYVPESQQFVQTVRSARTSHGVEAQPTSTSLRYTAMAGLGLSRLPEAEQRTVLAGDLAVDVLARAADRAESSQDPGAVALAAWAMAEASGEHPTRLLDRLARVVRSGVSLDTVQLAWIVTALVAVRLEGTGDLFETAAGRLLAARSRHGLYPHRWPARAQARWRMHVGSFADQVYPLQALARGYALTGDERLLTAANHTAGRLCRLQGTAGQWWWHYDTRTGAVVERYPVYAVHQHAMGPMVLMDLAEAGGDDHRQDVAAGLGWLQHPPETAEELVSERFGLVWRKVGRREPRKAARAAGAANSWVSPGHELRGLDRLLPARVVDHECRPYELGWMLYAWCGSRHD